LQRDRHATRLPILAHSPHDITLG